MTPDLSRVSPDIKGESPEETTGIQSLFNDARDYLEAFSWCARIREAYLGIAIAGVVGTFLFRIEPVGQGVDEWIWVVVGDLPPAYIALENAPNPACALDAYIGEMEKWVAAAKAGESVNDLIPVNVPPTLRN